MTEKIELKQTQDNVIYETIKTLFFAALIALSIRSLAFEPFSIPSGSMIPTLLVGDYLFVSKYTYGYSRFSFPLGIAPIEGRVDAKPVERGDVVVFRKPGLYSIDYIKRVIGLPGDLIQVKEGRLYINGKIVKRDYIGDIDEPTYPNNEMVKHKRYKETLPGGKVHEIIERSDNWLLDNTDAYLVPEDHYFMMGDNRDGSQDSRVMTEVGYVPYENIIGKAQFIFFSLDNETHAYELWKWPMSIRFKRIFQKID